MKKKIGFIVIGLVILLSACNVQKKTNPEPADATGQTASQQETYRPTQKEKDAIQGTWKYMDPSEKKHIYRIIFSEDGSVQLVQQNEIGELLSLSDGHWTVTGRDRLQIQLTSYMLDGCEIEETRRKTFGGEYRTDRKNDSTMILTCEDKSAPLVPGHEKNPAEFHIEEADLDKKDSDTEKIICDAVLKWYEDINKEPYPGIAEVDSIGPEGWIIHLYENMGDHIATSGWYTINPDTMIGTDDIIGEEIDFSPYCG